MPDLVLELLKYVFLAVLYIFVSRAIRAVLLELRPEGAARRGRGETPAPAPSRPPKRGKKQPRRATVVEGDSHKGKSFELGDEMIIGRAANCHMILDDTYVSQVHARIFARDDTFMVEDMGSTNGTYLNRQRITAPTELGRGDRLKIGQTVLEMRK